MAIHPTPELMEHLYEGLRKTRPFKQWKLPDGETIVFCVMIAYSPQADYFHDGTRHRIRLSAKRHHTLDAMTRTIAHEMVHLRQYLLGDKSEHGALFHKLAAQVCRHHVWDRGQF